MDVSQLYRAYVTTCGHVGSVKLWNVKVVKPAGTYWSDLLIVTNWAAQRSFSVNMLIHTGERSFIIPCPVPETDNCFALFYFVVSACISHVVITLICYCLIPKSRDLVSHNRGISGLKNGPGWSRDCNPYAWQMDRQTLRTSVRIVCISCIRCSLMICVNFFGFCI